MKFRTEPVSYTHHNAVLYVLEDKDGEKATILDSYGSESNYTGPEFDNFLREIPVEEKEEYNID